MTSVPDIVAAAMRAALAGDGPADAGAARPADGLPGAAHLSRLIETDIMPRLMAGLAPPAPAAAPARPVPPALPSRLARGLLADDVGPMLDLVAELHGDGHDALVLMEQLIAPAARLLGGWWLEDEIDFVAVTMGAWRCQQLIHFLQSQTPGPAPLPMGRPPRALILPAPGEQHVLGAMMVEEGFRRAGWATLGGPALAEDALVARVAEGDIDVLGLSVSATRLLAGTGHAITAVRGACPRRLVVIVGGPALGHGPAAAARAAVLGADGVAGSADEAVALAARQLGMAAQMALI